MNGASVGGVTIWTKGVSAFVASHIASYDHQFERNDQDVGPNECITDHRSISVTNPCST